LLSIRRFERWLLWPALAALVALAVYGSIANQIFAQWIWEPVGWRRFERFAVIFLAAAAIIVAILPRALPYAVVAFAAIYTILGVGAAPFFTVGAFLFACYVLGSAIFVRKHESGGADHFIALIAGLGVYIFALFFIVRVRVNYPAIDLALIALPLVLAWRRTISSARNCVQWTSHLWSRPLACDPAVPPTGRRKRLLHIGRTEAAAFALAAFILTAQLLVALKPDISADGLAMHLAIPADVAYHHRYTFDPAQTLWAVMPMGADFAYTLVYGLGGEYAAKLLNFAMLLVIAALLFTAARRRLKPAAAWVVVAVFASLPLVQWVTGSLFIENTLAVFCFGALVALWRLRETSRREYIFIAAFLLGSAIGIKFGALAFAAAVICAGAVLLWRHRAEIPHRTATAAIALSLFAAPACLPYANAWLHTGNPVYPFLNRRFPSQFLERDESFEDSRLREPIRWRTPYDITFHTSRFFEGQPGSAGFVILVLLPIAALALLLARPRDWLGLSALAVFFLDGLLVFASTPNLRYLFPVLPIACVGVACALVAVTTAAFGRVLIGVMLAITAVQIYLMPSSGWYHKDFYVSRLFHHGDAIYIREHAPVRALIEWLNTNAPDQPVLFIRDNQIAGLHGLAYSTVWHHYPFLRELFKCQTPEDVLRLVNRLGIRWFVAPDSWDNFSPPLTQFMAKYTVQRIAIADHYVAELRDSPTAIPLPDRSR